VAVTDRAWTLLVWGVLGFSVVACVVTAAMVEGRVPALGATVRELTARRWLRALLVLVWMWLGWHAFAR
jgi:hypothetical protein